MLCVLVLCAIWHLTKTAPTEIQQLLSDLHQCSVPVKEHTAALKKHNTIVSQNNIVLRKHKPGTT